jgi:tetratricopeptide (TPR) repeat protein
MNRSLLMAALAAGLLAAPAAQALYAPPDLEKIPVERLVENLEKVAKDQPKNVEVRFNLARAHGMAYAQKTETIEVNKRIKDMLAPWFGYEPAFVPYKAVKTDDKEKQEAAKKHLEQSIAAFKEVLKLDPNHLPAKLGLAWSIDQSGDKAAAIKAYREVIDEGWKKEKDLKTGPLGGHFITAEAAGYLIPLLDPKKNEDEIDELVRRSAQLKKLPRPITPIVVPLRDGLAATDLEDHAAAVAFDADGTGLKKKWTWVTENAAWLVFDPKGKGEVTSGLQLFGGVSFWLFWDNGYHALAALDDDCDGQLTGRELDGLALWHDANGNGVSDPGEVRPLASWGITAVSCRYERDAAHPDNIPIARSGVTFRDGSTRPTFDIILRPAK